MIRRTTTRRIVVTASVLALVAAVAPAALEWAFPGSLGDGASAAVRSVAPRSVEHRTAAPNAAETASPAPSAAPPSALPSTPDGPVPAGLRPSLADAARDYPLPYLDRCHVQQNGRSSATASCMYGDLTSSTTMVLFGDSHALSWFPAAVKVADRRGWRLQVLTMSACSPADIPSWNANYGRVSTECATWRQRALELIEAERPAIVLVAGTRGFATVDASGRILTGDARTSAWEAGMNRTLDRLVTSAPTVILIADVPLAAQDPPTCLAAHPSSVLACSTPVSVAVNAVWRAAERRSAAANLTDFIDPTTWVCPSSPCPAVIGHILVLRNTGHMSTVFAATLGGRLEAAIAADTRQSLAVKTLE